MVGGIHGGPPSLPNGESRVDEVVDSSVLTVKSEGAHVCAAQATDDANQRAAEALRRELLGEDETVRSDPLVERDKSTTAALPISDAVACRNGLQSSVTVERTDQPDILFLGTGCAEPSKVSLAIVMSLCTG